MSSHQYRSNSKGATDNYQGCEPQDASPGSLSTVGRLAEDMVIRWRDGERPITETYLDRFPHFRNCAEAVLELIAEELALREEYREPTCLADLNRRFPQWSAQIRALVQCQSTLGTQATLFPAVGEDLGDFHLVSELGRGSHARVYLAEQPSLGNRKVVLKLGPAAGREHLSLARLQHSHIVPLYSVHEFPEQGLRGLCLPYFGGTTLSQVLNRIKTSGGSIRVEDLHTGLHAPIAGGSVTPPESVAWKGFEIAAFPDVVCWVGVCLADALQYAHERGLLHLDLKPSNVLLAADGVPMLLDFHLARAPLHAGELAPQWLGGTPGYMAPEHLDAVQSVRDGTTIPKDLDARADVYSLGVVLREAISMSEQGGNSSAPSQGLLDIVARCTASNPLDRYPTAHSLATDLRRHLSHQSLRGVPNRSLRERWKKWRLRQPHALPVLLALGAIFTGFGGLVFHTQRLAERAMASQREGQNQLRQGRYRDAVESFRNGEVLAEGLPFYQELRSQLRESKLIAERGQAAAELHEFCEQIRPLYAADFATAAQSNQVARRCRELWEHRDELAAKLSDQLTLELDRLWKADLLDVAIIAARLSERNGSSGSIPCDHREALQYLEQAETLLGASGVLNLERSRQARTIGLHSLAEQAASRAQAEPPASAWDHLVIGRYYLASGDVRRAMTEMDRCLKRDPQSLWAHYYKGCCCLRLERGIEAIAEFSACVALAPNAAWCHHNLGRAYSAAGEPELALTSFDRALQLDPGLAASHLERAATYLRKGRIADSLADLREAADSGIPMAEIDYRKACVYLSSGDRSASIASLKSCLEREPRHQLAQEALARINASR